jgi:hypothetical protein
LFSSKFGIEIEFTGITRDHAARVAAEYFGGGTGVVSDYYSTQQVTSPDGRAWTFVSDSSISCQRRDGRRTVPAGGDYSVELVSPILTYHEDIRTVQELVRRLRKAGGFTNKTCGIHVHLDGANHTPRSIRNFVNIVAGHNDLFYKALQIPPERMNYCKKMDAYLVEQMNRQKPKTLQHIETIWYAGYRDESRSAHYHQSRYHFLNLHSFFTGNHTVELRGFNSELHAGKLRAYIVLALALDHQALTQKSASRRKVQAENEKFAMRVYLNRIGFIGDEFKSCREHLYRHLNGNAAWRYGHDLRLDKSQERGDSNG